MVVPSRNLISVLIGIVVACFLVYAYINPTAIYRGSQGEGDRDIVVEVNTARTIGATDTSIEDSAAGDTESVTQALSDPSTSPSPFTTSAAAETQPDTQSETQPDKETEHKIPDSWLHVKDTQQILQFVKRQCNKYNKTTGKITKTRLMVIPKNWQDHPILYASNPKTGSTSFKKWYHRIQGDTREYSEITGVHAMKKYGSLDSAWKYLNAQSPTPLSFEELISHFYKVGFIRNPLTRLISGFRDKVLRRTSDGMKPAMKVVNPGLTKDSSDEEKFGAFVECVMKGTIKNFHFTPQWNKQKICDFPYDLLAQTETTTQQIRIVQDMTNTTMFEFPGSRSDQGADSVATVNLAHKFYEKVRPEIMEKVYEYYKWDFALMGYAILDNPNFPYLDYSQNFEEIFKTLLNEQEPTDNPPATDTSYNRI